MNQNRFTPSANETVIFQAKSGKNVFWIYFLFFVLLLLAGSGTLANGIAAKTENAAESQRLIFWGSFVLALILPLALHYLSTRKRLFILTDKRIVILRNGLFKKSSRSLSLTSIHGVESTSNFLYDRIGLATIGFYSIAGGSNTTNFRLLSFSSISFKFQWLNKNDSERVHFLMQNYLTNNGFPPQSDNKDEEREGCEE